MVMSHEIRGTFKVLSRAVWKVYSDSVIPPPVAEEVHHVSGTGTQNRGTQTDAC